jgi:hypothetical protein
MSTLRVTNVQDTAGANSLTTAQIYNGAAKAWVNFNGVGTVAIRANFNVSSITDNGVGDYTVNFTNALADADYAVQGAVADDANFRRLFNIDGGTAFSTGSVRVKCKDAASGTTTLNADIAFMQVAIFR